MDEEKEPAAAVASVDDGKPLIFVSHDNRDAPLAEAFTTLLHDVSAGGIACFRSSDRAGADGIAFGTQWFPVILEKLRTCKELVCLLTPRSMARPWLLFEAGAVIGLDQRPVHGLAVGVKAGEVGAVGPFLQFQNVSCEEDQVVKLMGQLLDLNPHISPRAESVKRRVAEFVEFAKAYGDDPQNSEDSPGEAAATESRLADLYPLLADMRATLSAQATAVQALAKQVDENANPNHSAVRPELVRSAQLVKLGYSSRRWLTQLVEASELEGWGLLGRYAANFLQSDNEGTPADFGAKLDGLIDMMRSQSLISGPDAARLLARRLQHTSAIELLGNERYMTTMQKLSDITTDGSTEDPDSDADAWGGVD